MARPRDLDDDLRPYLAAIRRTTLLTPEREAELARRWVDAKDPRAAAELVERNLRFVIKVALSFRRYGLPLEDLVQEGNIGLMRAVEKYDPDRGTRLITYAVFWIRAQIQSHILASWSLVRVGTTQAQRRLFYRLPRLLGDARGAERRERIERLASDLEVEPAVVERMAASLSCRDLSLDAPIDDEGPMTWGDRVEDAADSPEDRVASDREQARRLRALEEAMNRLNARERRILELRHRTDEGMTLRDVGSATGMSRERVRQIEAHALRKLGNVARSRYAAA